VTESNTHSYAEWSARLGVISVVGGLALGWFYPPLFIIIGAFAVCLALMTFDSDVPDHRKHRATIGFMTGVAGIVTSIAWSLWQTIMWFQTLGIWL
jgi:tetrahydromethanopterin S-methyltransferase subunit C